MLKESCMDYEYVKPTEKIEVKEIYEKNANVPDQITFYKCFCGKGTIEYHCVPGFDDRFFYIECPYCNKKYRYMDWCGNEWKVYK